jgi:hypothetical protein
VSSGKFNSPFLVNDSGLHPYQLLPDGHSKEAALAIVPALSSKN